MKRDDGARLYLFAWRHARRVPMPLLYAIGNLAADYVWWRRGKAVRRLESNYARVRPELDAREIRHLARAGMRSYIRYFVEAFALPGFTRAQLDARVRVTGREHVDAALANHGTSVCSLAHLGNWDLAGAWAPPHLAPVLTVAERLKPEALFQQFLAFRAGLGLKVLALGDQGVFTELVETAKAGGYLIPLLADRDLTSRGVEVLLCGQPAKVAAGPATVALAAGVPMLPAFINYERLHGRRRRAAKSRWGIVINFGAPITATPHPGVSLRETPGQLDAGSKVLPREISGAPSSSSEMMQAWADALGEFLRAHTEDWHMLQKVFTADLTPSVIPAPKETVIAGLTRNLCTNQQRGITK